MIDGPSQVNVTREDRPDEIVLHAAHNGYVERFGIVHERTIVLSGDGTRLEGEDVLTRVGRGKARTANDRYAVRFHLHPSVKASRLGDGHGAMLMTPRKEVWTFAVRDGQVEIEDSVYLAGAEGPRRTAQLVIYGHAIETPRVTWSLQFTQVAAAPKPATRMARAEEPKLPL
jgi:uncharacterized heparinase superfamily protein